MEIEEVQMAGVPVKIVRPQQPHTQGNGRVLLNLHGGGFVTDSGSMLESIPLAALTGITVVTVLYRLTPQHLFPAAVDDAAAVYGELLKTHTSQNIVVYGTSAGGTLSAQLMVRLQRDAQPMPAALGFFTAIADLGRPGDSMSYFGVPGLANAQPVERGGLGMAERLGVSDARTPEVSPLYANLRSFPPTLCIAGTRDMLLSATANFQRALLRAGVNADLVVFDAMPHAHWYMVGIPEAREANELMAAYFLHRLGLPTHRDLRPWA
ncbi:MAG: alpha/beta hydrolase [Chloroflexi bacterium]|nr:alpha/beta hydrolase [Chloroflexota bacterium]